jgi:hypothetical protein
MVFMAKTGTKNNQNMVILAEVPRFFEPKTFINA